MPALSILGGHVAVVQDGSRVSFVTDDGGTELGTAMIQEPLNSEAFDRRTQKMHVMGDSSGRVAIRNIGELTPLQPKPLRKQDADLSSILQMLFDFLEMPRPKFPLAYRLELELAFASLRRRCVRVAMELLMSQHLPSVSSGSSGSGGDGDDADGAARPIPPKEQQQQQRRFIRILKELMLSFSTTTAVSSSSPSSSAAVAFSPSSTTLSREGLPSSNVVILRRRLLSLEQQLTTTTKRKENDNEAAKGRKEDVTIVSGFFSSGSAYPPPPAGIFRMHRNPRGGDEGETKISLRGGIRCVVVSSW
eukprot:jgi/Bigna1/130336/aug1.11_g5044